MLNGLARSRHGGYAAGLYRHLVVWLYLRDKVGRRKMFLLDIIAIGVVSVATMFCFTRLNYW